MRTKQLLEYTLKCILNILNQFYSWYKQQITLTYEEQQLEYIYDLNFENLPNVVGLIQKQFQWLDGIDSKEKFVQLKIKKDYQDYELDKFYIHIATIQEDQAALKEYINGGVFFCLKDYVTQVEDKFKEFDENIKENDHQAINNDVLQLENHEAEQLQDEEYKVFISISEYAKKRFQKNQFQKCDMDALLGKPFYGQRNDELLYDDFKTKKADLTKYQNIIMVNKIKPKNLTGMDGESIVKEIVVERLLQNLFKLGPRHLHYSAVSLKIYSQQPIKQIQQIKMYHDQTKHLLELLQYHQQEMMRDDDNDIDLKNQIKEIQKIADKFKWEEANQIQTNLNENNWDKAPLEGIKLKLEELWVKYSKVELKGRQNQLQNWIQVVKELKTKQKFQHLFLGLFPSNVSLIFYKKEFIEIMQYLI